MCHQAVGLIQGEAERRGIVTASITMLPEITQKVSPPRALAVPYALGYPMGSPGDMELQRSILEALLDLCLRTDIPALDTLELARGNRGEVACSS